MRCEHSIYPADECTECTECMECVAFSPTEAAIRADEAAKVRRDTLAAVRRIIETEGFITLDRLDRLDAIADKPDNKENNT